MLFSCSSTDGTARPSKRVRDARCSKHVPSKAPPKDVMYHLAGLSSNVDRNARSWTPHHSLRIPHPAALHLQQLQPGDAGQDQEPHYQNSQTRKPRRETAQLRLQEQIETEPTNQKKRRKQEPFALWGSIDRHTRMLSAQTTVTKKQECVPWLE